MQHTVDRDVDVDDAGPTSLNKTVVEYSEFSSGARTI